MNIENIQKNMLRLKELSARISHSPFLALFEKLRVKSDSDDRISLFSKKEPVSQSKDSKEEREEKEKKEFVESSTNSASSVKEELEKEIVTAKKLAEETLLLSKSLETPFKNLVCYKLGILLHKNLPHSKPLFLCMVESLKQVTENSKEYFQEAQDYLLKLKEDVLWSVFFDAKSEPKSKITNLSATAEGANKSSFSSSSCTSSSPPILYQRKSQTSSVALSSFTAHGDQANEGCILS